MKKGFVALVGAGPGDKELLTLRGMEYIRTANIILYDRLVSQDILALAPAHAEKVDVGKESSCHRVAQQDISRRLLEEALQGKQVVRLKGGDPFLFGRGGEELELLEQHGIPFAVVPGIPSAFAVPAYAGIPVTHRDFCSSVHVITGHRKEGSSLGINFDALTAVGGTLVFLMGVASLKQILDGLMQAGMAGSVPAAMIENGTKPCQRKVVATVGTLYEKAVELKIKSPAVTVVGEVCCLSERLDWFSKGKLFGTKVIVTRPRCSGGTLSTKLRALGAEVIDFPCIEICEISPNPALENAIRNIQEYDWMVFTSKNGVHTVFSGLRRMKKDVRLLSGIKLAAIGAATAQALEDYGLFADYIPEVFDGKHLAEGLCKAVDAHEKILLVRARKGNKEILDILREHGRTYEDVAVYDTVSTEACPPEVEMLVCEHPEVYVTFTSASTVEGFVRAAGDIDLKCITGICIGMQTAEAAKQYGIPHFVSGEATIDGMIQTILEVQESRKMVMDMDMTDEGELGG